MFSSLTPSEHGKIAGAMATQYFKGGKTIITQGAVGNVFYIILVGEVRIVKDGKEVIKLGAKQFFGEVALLGNSTRRSATVVADSDTVIAASLSRVRMNALTEDVRCEPPG